MFQNPIDNLIEYLDSREQIRLAARLRGSQIDDAEVMDLLDRLSLGHRVQQLSAASAAASSSARSASASS